MDKTKKYELVAPDGGYGFVILIAVTINMSILGTHLNCYGILYSNYFIELDMKSTHITLLAGISALFSALSGFMTAPLLKVLSYRQAILLGSLLYNCGIFFIVFAEHKIIFFVFQGVIQNIGYGIIINISYTIINEYFVKKRILVIGISQTIVAFVAFIEPHIFKITTEWYGHRGTLIIVCAISVHSFVAGMLTQPVAGHMKRVEITYETEMKNLLKEHTEMSQKTPADINASCNLEIKYKESFINRLKRVIDVELIKSYSSSVECWGPGICIVIDLTYMYMIPPAFNSFGWSEGDVAWAFSLVALGDLLSRIFIIILSKMFNKIGSSRVFIFGIFLAFATRLGITAFDDMTVVLTLFTILGISRCILFVVSVLVIADAVGPEKYPAALGISMLGSGIGNLTLAPIIGGIRDFTDSYKTVFNLITAIFGIIGVIWICKLILKKKCTQEREPKLPVLNKNLNLA